MTLELFAKTLICDNTLVRLWFETVDGYKQITNDDGREVGMEWEIISGKGWQAKYAHHLVIGVKDIYCEGPYVEAVNIVISDNPVTY